jgi:hypothetical protein
MGTFSKIKGAVELVEDGLIEISIKLQTSSRQMRLIVVA